MLEIKIVFTGVFNDVGIRYEAYVFCHRPLLGIDFGIIDCYLNFHVPEVHPPKALSHMQVIRVGLPV